MKPNYLLLITLMFLFGCKSQSDKFVASETGLETITINFAEDEIIDIDLNDAKTIPLEVTDNSLLATVRQISEYNEDYLVQDNNRLSLFDKDGKFKYNVGNKGRGPGEYLELSSSYFNEDTVSIYCWMSKKIYNYLVDSDKFAFDYIGFDTIPRQYILNRVFKFANSDNYVATNVYRGIGGVTPVTSVYDNNLNLIKNSERTVDFGGISSATPIYVYDSLAYNIWFFSDTVQVLTSSGNIYPKYLFDFGDTKIPQIGGTFTKLQYAMANKDKAFSIIDQVSRFGDYIYFTIKSNNQAYILRYNSKTGQKDIYRFMDSSSSEQINITSQKPTESGLIIIPAQDEKNEGNPILYIVDLD